MTPSLFFTNRIKKGENKFLKNGKGGALENGRGRAGARRGERLKKWNIPQVSILKNFIGGIKIIA